MYVASVDYTKSIQYSTGYNEYQISSISSAYKPWNLSRKEIEMSIKPTEVYRAFQINPSQIYSLEYAGKLRKRPRGMITKEWLIDLRDWYQSVRGNLPTEAVELLTRIDA